MHPRSRLNKSMEWPSVEALNAERDATLQALGSDGCAAKTELWDIELVLDPGDEGFTPPAESEE